MIYSLYKLHSQFSTHNSQVRFFVSFFSLKHHFFTTTSLQSLEQKTHNAQLLNPSSTKFHGIVQSILSADFQSHKTKNELGLASISIRDLVLQVSDLSPEIARRFRRVSELKPDDVLELLLGFQCFCENYVCDARKVETLWGIFKWASDQSRDFKHHTRSCEVMLSMLVRGMLFREVELLLFTLESQGFLLDNRVIFGDLIVGYVSVLELERAFSVYSRMRERGLFPPLFCYLVLIDFLVRKNDTRLVFRVCMDMVDIKCELGDAEKSNFHNAVKLLCRDGKIYEARNLVKKGMDFGLEPSNVVLNEIASGYCEKRDFEDALRFFTEVRRIPDVLVCNKIISSLCRNCSTERAHRFMQELMQLGFVPDEITFGIFIAWRCHEGEIKKALHYLSDTLSRGLTPDICSYNALMSGMFKEGMGRHAKDIFLEMIDRGISPTMATFKVLLAGYCQARQFDEAKKIISEMINRNLIEVSPVYDPLSIAFSVLGFDPLDVRVKRDNHVALANTEFFDTLGNGLYLDTDIDEYEKKVEGVLNDSIIPDFNSLVMKECGSGNFKAALVKVDEMVKWGQELSLPSLSALLKSLCASNCHIRAITSVLDKMPKFANQLDQEILNLLVQTYSKKGSTYNGKRIMDKMLQTRLKIENESYSALLMGLYKKKELKEFRNYWDLARKENWLPNLEDCKFIVNCLCMQKMVKQTLDLFESLMVTKPPLVLEIYNICLEELCATGYTSIAKFLLEKVQLEGDIQDHIAYSHLIRGFIKEKRFSEAFIVFDIMLSNKFPLSFDVSVFLIPHLCKFHRIEHAIALKEVCLREISSNSLPTYGALMNAFCKAGEIREVVNLFHDMSAKGLGPDSDVYNILVQVYCHANNFKKIEELLGAMIRKNASLSFSSYRKLVRLACVKSRVLWAFNVKETMLTGIKSAHYIIIYNILIFYLLLTRNDSMVNSLLEEMQKKGLIIDEVTYNFLVHGFCENRDISSSLFYLTTMISKNLKPNARCMRAVICYLCNNGEFEKALELSKDIEMRNWVQGTIIQNKIAEGLLCKGRFQEAENYLEKMVEKCLISDTINYDNLIKRFCWYGRLRKAVDLLNVMLMKQNIPNSSSYDSIIQCFCACHDLERAMDFHAEMLDMNLKPNIKTWDMLVDIFCKQGKTSNAEKLLFLMAQTGEPPTKKMYRSVINRYRFENNYGKASEMLQAMQNVGYDPDFETHWSLISKLSDSDKDNGGSKQGFLSRLLSGSGFSRKNSSNTKQG